jgi:hypothetical protein
MELLHYLKRGVIWIMAVIVSTIIGIYVVKYWSELDKLTISPSTTSISILIAIAGICVFITYLVTRWYFSRKKKEIISASIFEAEIVDKKQAYIRGQESVSFRSRFKGNVTNGCFLNKIRMIKQPEAQDISGYLFSPYIKDVDITRQFVSSFCPQTVEQWSDSRTGILDGDVDTGWMKWDWKIPEKVRLGKYSVLMTIQDNFSRYSQSKNKNRVDTFEIIDPDDSNNPQRFSPSVSDS